jgi:hypothetical protein
MPEFSLNIVAGSRCGKTTTAHQFVFANATPERPALHFTILGASPRYQRDGISGAQLPAPFRNYHQSQVAPARGNERVGPSWRCGLRYSARSTVEATRKADEHRPGKIIWPKFGAGSNIETPGVLPL